MITVIVNGQPRAIDDAPDKPLLWVLRDGLKLRGTKYGCGVGVCGICTVLIDGVPNHACMVPLAQVADRSVVTLEGAEERCPALLASWIEEQVPQCGYCQGGQLLAAAALLERNLAPSDADIDAALSGILCRCGTYPRIRRAIRRAAREPGARPVLPPPRAPAPDAGVALDAFVRLHADHTLTLRINHSEMGQGTLTSLALLVAEELDFPVARVRTEFAPADPVYGNPLFGEQFTGGSSSIRGEWEPLRLRTAAARARLVAAAAQRWAVEPADCRTAEGQVVHPDGERRLSYAELAADAASRPSPRSAAPKPSAAYSLVGRQVARLDIPDMVTGRTVYGIDVQRPGMRVATVVRCPEIGGRLRRYDAAAARAMPGVEQVVEITTGVAVVARDAWTALRGRERLVVEWQSGRQAELSHERLYAELEGAAGRRGEPLRDTGQVERTLKAAARVARAHYLTPLLAHATLEPMNCVTEVSDDGCDIWVGTQSQSNTQAVAANLTGLAKRKVRVHTQFLGGGFGRRLETDFVAEAVELAAKLRQPVQVLWTRADDLRHALYRPAGLVAIEAALGDDGLPQAWRTRLVGDALVTQGIRPLLYRLPHFREEHVEVKSPLPAAAWRAVGAPQHAFAVESFVDELAFAGGTDPLDYRRALLVDAPRLRGTLELAVDAGRWGRALPPGHGRGLACYQSFGSYAAAVVELRVAAGAIQVTRVACALDCGRVVNPDAVRAQLEGSVAMGLSAALKEELRIEAGRVAHQSLADYPILTLAEMPEVEVLLVPSDEPPGGVGEPGVPVIAPAVANAVFAATGRRLRRLPLRMP